MKPWDTWPSQRRSQNILIFFVSWCLLFTGIASTASDKVIFGQSASFSGGAWEPAPQFNTGLLGAFHEVNTKEGGINGRQIELVSFDDQYNVSLIAPNIEKLLAVPDVFCFVSFMGSPTTAAALPLVSAAQMPIIGPVTGSAVFRKVFNPWTINVRAGYDDEALTMLRLFVTEKQFRRISIIYQDDPFGEPAKNIIVEAMHALKLKPTSIHKYYRPLIEEYDYVQYAKEVLQYKPQGVILYCVEGFSNAFMREFFKIQTYPVSFVTGSWIGEGNRRYLQANNLDATNFYQTQVVPHPASSMNITKRYREAIYARNGTSAQFDYLSVEGYIVGRMIAEALRRTPETSDGKLNRADFLETIYNTKLFGIDELLIGPFSNDCEYDPGTAKGRSSMCQCNQGLRSVSTTRLTSTYDYVPAGVKEMIYPITECWATIDVVTRPVLVALLTNKNNSATTQRIAEGLSLDTTSHNVVVKELVASTSATAKDSFVAFSNDHLVLGGVNGMEVDYEEKYPVFPTFGAIPFQHEFHRSEIYLLATIQQQIHVACSKISADSTAPIYVVLSNAVDAMSSETGESMRSVLSNAFEIYKLSATNFLTFGTASELSQVMAEIPIAAEVLVYGVGSNELFEVLLDKMLSSQIQAYVSFDEMLVNHDIVESRFPNGTSSNVPSRLFFATNLPLWTGDSVFAGGYQQHMKAAGLGANVSNPQYFTGYFISKIMHFVLARAGEASPAAFMEELYRTSVVAVDDVSLGPFIEEQCSNEDCLCNVGPREVDLYTIAGVRERVESPIQTTRFSKCRVPTALQVQSSGNEAVTIFGIILGVVCFLLVVMAIFIARGFLRKPVGVEYAPLTESEPFVVIAFETSASTSLLEDAANFGRCYLLKHQVSGATVVVSREVKHAMRMLRYLQAQLYTVPTVGNDGALTMVGRNKSTKLLAAVCFGHGKIVPPMKRSDEPHYSGRVIETTLELFDIVISLSSVNGCILSIGEVAAMYEEATETATTSLMTSFVAPLEIVTNPLGATSVQTNEVEFDSIAEDDDSRPNFREIGDMKFSGDVVRRISSVEVGSVRHPPKDDVTLAVQRFVHVREESQGSETFTPQTHLINLQQAKIVTRRGSALLMECTNATTLEETFHYHDIFGSIIEHFGGEVESRTSLHALATFGVHRANVLHEQNASRAALKIHEHLLTSIYIASGKMISFTAHQHGEVVRVASGEALCQVHAMANHTGLNAPVQEKDLIGTRIFVQQEVVHATAMPSIPFDIVHLIDNRSGELARKETVYELFDKDDYPFRNMPAEASVYRSSFDKLRQGEFAAAAETIQTIQKTNGSTARLAKLARHLVETKGVKDEEGFHRNVSCSYPTKQESGSGCGPGSSTGLLDPKNGSTTLRRSSNSVGAAGSNSLSNSAGPTAMGSTSELPLRESVTEKSRRKREEVNDALKSRVNLTSVDDGLFSLILNENAEEATSDEAALELPHDIQDVTGVTWSRSNNPVSAGSFAVVYKAISEQGRVVSIKCFDMEGSAANITAEDVANEVSTLSSYAHENIIGYITYGFVGRYCFIVMEHAAGGSLNQVLRDFGVLSVGTARNYFREALRGLEYLHSHNVIHCDVKPHNILIGSDGICKIADFGSTVDSAFSSSMITERTVIARGTPGYMAPEACRGSETAAGDIYGIGISMVELLTGELPWGKMGNLNHFIARLGKDTTLEPKIPDSFDKNLREVVAAMLQRDPRDRPTATEALNFAFFTSGIGDGNDGRLPIDFAI